MKIHIEELENKRGVAKVVFVNQPIKTKRAFLRKLYLAMKKHLHPPS